MVKKYLGDEGNPFSKKCTLIFVAARSILIEREIVGMQCGRKK